MDETPKGWYVQYIDRDPETIRRQEELARKKKHDLDDEERSAKFIEEQVRRGKDGKEEEVSTGEADAPWRRNGEVIQMPFILKETPIYTELKRESEEEKGETEGRSTRLGCFPASLLHHLCFFAVAFNLGASSVVAGPSKPRYSNIICHNPAAVVGLSCLNACFQPLCSPALGAGALKEAAVAAVASAKRKDTSSEPRSEKKRKSALEEIIEVGAGP